MMIVENVKSEQILAISPKLLEDVKDFFRLMAVISRNGCFKVPLKVGYEKHFLIGSTKEETKEYFDFTWPVPKWRTDIKIGTDSSWFIWKLEENLWMRYYQLNNIDPHIDQNVTTKYKFPPLSSPPLWEAFYDFWDGTGHEMRIKLISELFKNLSTTRNLTPHHQKQLRQLDLFSNIKENESSNLFLETIAYSPIARGQSFIDICFRHMYQYIREACTIVSDTFGLKKQEVKKKKKTKKKKVVAVKPQLKLLPPNSECVICMENMASFTPTCGHLAYCKTCIDTIKSCSICK